MDADNRAGEAEAFHQRGVLAYKSGQAAEALRLFGEVLIRDCGSASAYNNLGSCFVSLGMRDRAIICYARAVKADPDFDAAYRNLGAAFDQAGRLEEAAVWHRKALIVAPANAEAHFSLGTVEKAPRAAESYRRALVLDPTHAEAANNLGSSMQTAGDVSAATALFKQALAISPGVALLHASLGVTLRDIADIEGAIICLRRAVWIDPTLVAAQTNLLLTCHYTNAITPEELLAKSRSFSAALGHGTPRAAFSNDRGESRPLRIGYVSSDFFTHSVAYFLEPLLQHHDREKFEIYAYSGVGKPDATTSRLKASCHVWRDVGQLGDDDLTALIKQDQIDILIDLAGHTRGGRMAVFAKRAAPVQVTWLGYPGTTGIEAMDYRFIDAVTDPEGDSDTWASETLVRLPDGFLCYLPPRDAPPTSRRPADRPLTLGSFNNPAKLTSETLDLWAAVLRRLPESRLLLKGKVFAEAAVRNRLLRQFADRGVAAARIDLVDRRAETADHLALYAEVDIALETVPYNGTTTTCEALWMGVPVIGLRGTRHVSRVGASLLSHLGLGELVADTAEAYVEVAAGLAASPERLAELSATMRDRMRVSHLCDGSAFAAKIETAYERMWRAETSSPKFAIEMFDGTRIVAPKSLSAITSYVLLEQERWFEKEFDFVLTWLGPGMKAIDIGANLGVYSLSMARRVGPSGRVVAYEPASDTRRYLAAGKDLNGVENLDIRPVALSDRTGHGHLAFGASSELNALSDGGAGEQVELGSFASEQAAGYLPAADFVKIDAEGEELRILAGGRDFFERMSPLVMFEIVAGDTRNDDLPAAFVAMGYRIYRCLAGAPLLVPVREGDLDSFELNLFAAKPDRAESLKLSGHLVDERLPWRSDGNAMKRLVDVFLALPYAEAYPACFSADRQRDEAYEHCLAAFAIWLTPEEPLPRRWAALEFAADGLAALCGTGASFARLLTLARVTWEAGRREECIKALHRFLSAIETEPYRLGEPFWPASPRFDGISPGAETGDWAVASAVELLEEARGFSSIFAGTGKYLDWLCAGPFSSPEMLRRKALNDLRQRGETLIPSGLLADRDDHRNASLWRDGTVQALQR